MTLTLELPIELERNLSSRAEEVGLPLDDYVLELLQSEIQVMPQTGKELVEYWRKAGVIGMLDNVEDSAAHARALRAQAETRQQQP